MEILYPKNYVKEAEVLPSKATTTTLKTFIKNLVKTQPVLVEEVIKSVDKKYIETNDERYHFLAEDISVVCKEVDVEFRPEELVVVK